MSSTNRLIPRQPVPSLSVPTVGGGQWTLGATPPRTFTLLVFYRGLHCPICSRYLADLDRRLPNFEAAGVEVVAISSDPADRAERARNDWGLSSLTLGYGLEIAKGREWGLYISAGRGSTSAGVEEPALFIEPALYLVRPDQTLYAASLQTMPFARPSFSEVLGAVEFVIQKDYPARGEA